MPRTDLFIGLMSGTSLDGADGVLVRFDVDAATPVTILAHAHRGFDAGLASELLSLNSSSSDELHRGALAGNALVRVYADVVADLLRATATLASSVRAVGAHGQTVRHRPREFDGTGYTIQLNNPALLAELTGIDIVADFRSRDLAAGGQGAPLVPAFHRFAFAQGDESLAVLNIGGIANLSAIAPSGATLGFDSGPGNALMNLWCRRHLDLAFDDDGRWAASGQVLPDLLAALQSDPYFAIPPPKSTGRDLFNAAWLDRHLGDPLLGKDVAAEDVQATLAELTAWCCAEAVSAHAPAARRVMVCGGGAFNGHLMKRLAALAARPAVSTTDCGLANDQVEAAAFAWLARACIDREPGNLASVTGALGPRVLGAIYPSGLSGAHAA